MTIDEMNQRSRAIMEAAIPNRPAQQQVSAQEIIQVMDIMDNLRHCLFQVLSQENRGWMVGRSAENVFDEPAN